MLDDIRVTSEGRVTRPFECPALPFLFGARLSTFAAMMRAGLVMVFATLIVACGSGANNGPDAPGPDTNHHEDAAIDSAGSGSPMAIESSPHDHHLDLMVVGLGMVIAAPVGLRRRRDAR